jgi:glycine/D-amino acid oxidase-like deaminating enzyme
MGSTVRRIAEQRIVVRNAFTYNPATRIGEVHDRSFELRFPMLSGVTAEYRWGGQLVPLPDARLRRNRERGVYAACCCNGLGTVLAAGSGDPMIEDALSEPTPEKLYPEPKGRLWWMQKRARREL